MSKHTSSQTFHSKSLSQILFLPIATRRPPPGETGGTVTATFRVTRVGENEVAMSFVCLQTVCLQTVRRERTKNILPPAAKNNQRHKLRKEEKEGRRRVQVAMEEGNDSGYEGEQEESVLIFTPVVTLH